MKFQRQGQIQIQMAKQHANDIWNRVLFSLEVLEYALNEVSRFPISFNLNKILGDLPSGSLRNQVEKRLRSGDIEEADLGVQLQIRTLKKILKNKEISIESDMLWLAKDFLSWIGGRKNLPWSRVDEYSLAILKCIDGASYNEVISLLPRELGENKLPISQNVILETVQTMATAAHLVDKTEKNFMENEQPVAEQTTHERGKIEDGIERIKKNWTKHKLWFTNSLLPELELEEMVYSTPITRTKRQAEQSKSNEKEERFLSTERQKVPSSNFSNSQSSLNSYTSGKIVIPHNEDHNKHEIDILLVCQKKDKRCSNFKLACLYELKDSEKGIIREDNKGSVYSIKPPHIIYWGKKFHDIETIQLLDIKKIKRVLFFIYKFIDKPDCKKSTVTFIIQPKWIKEKPFRSNIDIIHNNNWINTIMLFENNIEGLAFVKQSQSFSSEKHMDEKYLWGINWE